jgi:hypothetical protein
MRMQIECRAMNDQPIPPVIRSMTANDRGSLLDVWPAFRARHHAFLSEQDI